MATRWTRMAVVWLLGMAVFIGALAVYGIASSRWACDVPPELSGYRLACDLAWVLGAVAAVVAGLHVVVAASIQRRHLRGAVAGVVLCVMGLLACSSSLEDERWWLVLPVAAGYLGTLLILAHATVRGWDQGRNPA